MGATEYTWPDTASSTGSDAPTHAAQVASIRSTLAKARVGQGTAKSKAKAPAPPAQDTGPVGTLPVYEGKTVPLLPHNAPGYFTRAETNIYMGNDVDKRGQRFGRWGTGTTTSEEMAEAQVHPDTRNTLLPGVPVGRLSWKGSGHRGRPRKDVVIRKPDGTEVVNLISDVRPKRDFTKMPEYPGDLDDDDIVWFTETTQRRLNSGGIETIPGKMVPTTTTWREFKKGQSKFLGGNPYVTGPPGREQPYMWDKNDVENFGPIGQFIWLPGMRNTPWFQEKFSTHSMKTLESGRPNPAYKQKKARGIVLTRDEAVRWRRILTMAFPLRRAGSLFQNINTRLTDRYREHKLKLAQDEAERLDFEAMYEQALDVLTEEERAEAIEFQRQAELRRKEEEENAPNDLDINALDTPESYDGLSEPSPAPVAAPAPGTLLVAPLVDPALPSSSTDAFLRPAPRPPSAPSSPPSVFVTRGDAPPPAGSPGAVPYVTTTVRLPEATAPKPGPKVVTKFQRQKNAIREHYRAQGIEVEFESDSDSGGVTPPPEPAIAPTAGGGEVAVGSSGPRDILDVPSELQRTVYSPMFEAMKQSGVYGRPSQVRPPAPPPTAPPQDSPEYLPEDEDQQPRDFGRPPSPDRWLEGQRYHDMRPDRATLRVNTFYGRERFGQPVFARRIES